MQIKNGRALVSLAIAAGFLAIAITGVLLFFVKHSTLTAAIHTSFGLVFLAGVGFHVRNNLRPLTGYAMQRKSGTRPTVKRELVAIITITGLATLGLVYQWPGFAAVYDWGNAWRSQQENKEETRIVYQKLQSLPPGAGRVIEVDVRKGKAFSNPLFAVWIEDTAGHYLDTLYVSKTIGSSRFDYGSKKDGKWVPDIVRRPEALPYWGHQRGIRAKDGYFLPDPDSPVPDIVSAATPTESFRLTSRVPRDQPFRLLLEVNQSYDWNESYAKTSYPNDPIYSGSGKVGQPSLVYAATIDPKPGTARFYALNPVGHGHPSGSDGALHADLAGITSALEIVDGVLVRLGDS